jgi:uncharacterized protein (DUF169 family)
MQQNIIFAETIKKVTGILREPVAVKFISDETHLSEINPIDYDADTKSRYCQAVMRATRGEKVILSADNISCAAAAAAFGLKPLHPKLASGEAHFNVGTFGTQEAAKKMMGDMSRLSWGDYNFVLIAPLALAEFEPDVVLVEAPPENLMWLALAYIYTTGERLQFSTSIVQATCVDCTVIPFTGGKINATLGCSGCREATDLHVTENMIGIPYASLSPLVDNLVNMKEVIAKNRSKSVYERFNKK